MLDDENYIEKVVIYSMIPCSTIRMLKFEIKRNLMVEKSNDLAALAEQ